MRVSCHSACIPTSTGIHCVVISLQDAFVRLQYRLPLLASEPSKCWVRFGALDAIYCHSSLLRIAGFLDDAWPAAPDLDPLAVKASVSLKEVVQGSVRSAQLQSLETQSLPGLQVRINSKSSYRFLFPCSCMSA